MIQNGRAPAGTRGSLLVVLDATSILSNKTITVAIIVRCISLGMCYTTFYAAQKYLLNNFAAMRMGYSVEIGWAIL